MQITQKKPGLVHVDELAELKMIVESLPLTTAEYCSALNHLTNAQNYSAQGEVGAALFELKLVIAKLNQR